MVRDFFRDRIQTLEEDVKAEVFLNLDQMIDLHQDILADLRFGNLVIIELIVSIVVT